MMQLRPRYGGIVGTGALEPAEAVEPTVSFTLGGPALYIGTPELLARVFPPGVEEVAGESLPSTEWWCSGICCSDKTMLACPPL